MATTLWKHGTLDVELVVTEIEDKADVWELADAFARAEKLRARDAKTARVARRFQCEL